MAENMSRILFQRRTVWWPTRLGWICFFLAPIGALMLWLLFGEAFLAVTDKSDPDTLLVEGWVGKEGITAAKAEFDRGNYRYFVVTGGPNKAAWLEKPMNLADAARNELLRQGVPAEKVISAPCEDSELQRTYTSAVAAKRMLESRGVHPKDLNILTRGAHARRSYLIYTKVFKPDTRVGVISWFPSDTRGEAWWQSSARAKEFLDETVGFTYEAFFNSGREGKSKTRLLQLGLFCGVIYALARIWRRHVISVRPDLTIDLSSQPAAGDSKAR
jgi:hypothetical protein